MAYEVKYGVDLKAIREMYPDAENAKPVLDNIVQIVKNHYDTMRNQELNRRQYARAQGTLGTNIVDVEVNAPTTDIGTFDDVVVATHSVTQGMTYNDVVTVGATIVFTTTDAEAVKLLSKIEISGTFYIEPTYRVTGY